MFARCSTPSIIDRNAWIDAANIRFTKANRHLDGLNAARAEADPPLPPIAAVPMLERAASIKLSQDGSLIQPTEGENAASNAP
jgi:hypothetical protein